MNQPTATPNTLNADGASTPFVAANIVRPEERGRGYGLEIILWVLEQNRAVLFLIPTVFAVAVMLMTNGGWPAFVAGWFVIPFFAVVVPAVSLLWGSWEGDSAANWSEYISWKNTADNTKWEGKKIPMEVLYEAYMRGDLEFKKDVYETLLRRNQLFRFSFTWGDVKFYFREFLTQGTTHSVNSDHGDIAHVYNRGNDFYNWFLGPSMTYTSGMFLNESDTLEEAQDRKLETICQYVHMKPGDKHLDIGCGWGPMVVHAAKHHGTHSTGITLAQEQADWANKRAADNGVADRVNIIVDDYRNLPAVKYDKITCLEMAEHVGVKNFQKFLLQVRGMLKDDGIFYLQIAGLRRAWRFEDLVWGLFMAKYIFPGADASCPLGFVINQAERAEWEIHRVENCGQHYTITIQRWYNNWVSNKDAIIAKYGQRWYRMWLVFLGWSVIIGRQGSSTVFMITMTKNHANDKDSVTPEEAVNVPFSRREYWVGPKVIGTQQ